MKKRKGVIILALSLLAILVSLYFDSYIVKGIAYIRTDVLNDIFMGLTFVSSAVIIFFVLTSLFLWNQNKRRWILPLWISLTGSAVVSYLLKIGIQRSRPFQLGIVSTLPALAKSSHLGWNTSFPSFQAMLVFCAIPILSREFPKARYIWITFAALVAFSRVYFGLHFLSDVIAGAMIGYLIGWVVVKTERDNKTWSKIYKKIGRLFRKI